MLKTLKDHPVFAVIGAIGAISGIVFGVLSLIEPKYATVTDGNICGYSELTKETYPHKWKECQNPNKVTGYRFKEEVSQSSGWVGGGKDQNWHCTNVKRAKEAAVGMSIVWSNQRSSEEKKEEFPRRFYYKYHCTIFAQWDPIYTVERWEGCGKAPPAKIVEKQAKTCIDETQRIGWKWKWK